MKPRSLPFPMPTKPQHLGGKVPEGRVKKARKAKWQLVLGLKQIICGALGIAWMMLVIFVLGVLAGRGDIYRWLSSWGLMSPEAPKIVQWSPPPEPPAAAPSAGPTAKSSPAAPPAATAAAPAPSTSASPPAPVTGSLTGVPSSPATSSGSSGKKTRKGLSAREQKAKDEELRRLRQEVAPKLKFQNSFDSTPPKPGRAGLKQKDKSATAKTQSVQVARFRDAKAAKAKIAELQKKGEKVTLKQGKDQEGAYFDVIRQTPVHTREAEATAPKPQKSATKKSKSATETNH